MNLDDDMNDNICYVKPGNDPALQWKIALLASILDDAVKWFHTMMGYQGEKQLQRTLQECYYHPKLRQAIDRLKCSHCQMHKLSGCGYWLLPEFEV